MKKVLKSIVILFASIFVIVFANGCYFVFKGQEKAMSKIHAGKELNFYECCNAYTMHMALWMFGWPMSPEAAKECFLLHFHQKDTVQFKLPDRAFSPKLKAACESLRYEPVGASVYLAWNGDNDYALNSPEHRATLALNPCKITKVVLSEPNTPSRISITSPMV